ncbi:MAG TPA: hypothetical protein VHC70_07790 [Phycisphaerales bacterium]|nr:hypothetical protein [Phycisphaerales bacterium]
MKPHPRIRKTIKWGGAAVTLLLVVVWIASGGFFASWSGPSGCGGGVSEGCVALWDHGSVAPQSRTSMFLRTPSYRLHLWAFVSRWTSCTEWSMQVPLWLPAMLTVVVSAAAWRLDSLARRRARLNLCAKCHYNRAGLAAVAKCPECGEPPALS